MPFDHLLCCHLSDLVDDCRLCSSFYSIYTTDMKCTVYRIVGYIKWGFKFGGFVAIFRKSAKFNSMGVGVYGYVHVVAVDTASPAEVSTEGRTCVEVLHSQQKK